MAESGGEICGIVWLCEEENVLVLRGMRVRKDLQRRGIGSRLLRAAEPMTGGRMCFCIPHRHLRSFYARIGFQEIRSNKAPSFLEERYNRYRFEYGLDVILMHRK
jgi:N-acetylglutamate synthase-like GNAT family acetyltransferase